MTYDNTPGLFCFFPLYNPSCSHYTNTYFPFHLWDLEILYA